VVSVWSHNRYRPNGAIHISKQAHFELLELTKKTKFNVNGPIKVIQGHALWNQWKDVEGLNNIIILALPLKLLKKYRAKILKIAVFDTPLSFDAPCPGNSREHTHKPYICQKLNSLDYIFTADSVGLSSLKYSWWAPKTHVFWNRVRKGPSISSKVVDFDTNRKLVCNFLLVINSKTLVLSCPVSEILQVFCWKWHPNPYSTLILGAFPWTRLPMLGLRRAKTLS